MICICRQLSALKMRLAIVEEYYRKHIDADGHIGKTFRETKLIHSKFVSGVCNCTVHAMWFICYIEDSYPMPLTRYGKLRLPHAPGMPRTFSPPLRVSDPGMLHGTRLTHVPWWMPGSLTSSFLWSRWRGKRPRHSRRMRNPQHCVSDKRPKQWNQ